MQRETIVNLLILDTPENASETVKSLINCQDFTVNVERVTQQIDLIQHLEQKEWELVILNSEVKGFDIESCKNCINENNRVVALIVLTPKLLGIRDLIDAFELGINAFVSLSEPDYLAVVVKRELHKVQLQKELLEKVDRNKELVKRCQLLLDSSTDAVAYIHEGMHIYANTSYLRKFKYETLKEVIGIPFLDMVGEKNKPELKECLNKGQNYVQEVDALDSFELEIGELEIVGICENGVEFNAQAYFEPSIYDGEACVQVLINTEAEEQRNLNRVTNRDNETGLFNRSFFLTQLDDLIQSIRKAKSVGGTLLFLHLQGLENILATTGYTEITDLIVEIATKIKQIAGKKNITSRFSGDIFTILINEKDELGLLKEESSAIYQSIQDYISTSLSINQTNDFPLTFNITKVDINRQHKSAKEVLKLVHHEQFSNRTVVTGQNILEDQQYLSDQDFFEGQENSTQQDPLTDQKWLNNLEPVVNKQIVNKQIVDSTENRINTLMNKKFILDAIKDDLFTLAYQPVIAVAESDIELYEIYLRLYDKKSNLYMPTDFLDVVNSNGLGNRLDRWVIETALKVLVSLYNQGKTVQFVLNITEQSMQDNLFAEWLAQSMQNCGLGHEAVVINLYEEIVLENVADTCQLVERMNSAGVKVCISRFTYSQSILDLLEKIDIDYLKLSEAMSKAITSDKSMCMLFKEQLINLHSKGIKVIAPNVESSSVLSTFWTTNIDFVQGNYFQKAEEDISFVSFNEKIEM